MSFPAVATVIGLSQEVAESGPLLATLALDPNLITSQKPPQPVEIKAEDPVTQAVVDNIIGKLPTKKEQVKLRCEDCNITVSSKEVLDMHYAGSKHAKKVKGRELVKEIKDSSSFSFVATDMNALNMKSTEFTCNICSISVNSSHQLQQHLAGTRHKNKANADISNTMQVSVTSEKNGDNGTVAVNIRRNRLFCAACNVQVNSELQLHQHIQSTKHKNKVNGNGDHRKRTTPYDRRTTAAGFARKKNFGWTHNSSSYGWAGTWPMRVVAPNRSFVPGGMLYDNSY